VEHGEIPGKADECEHDILTGLMLWSSAKMNQIPCLGVIMIAGEESLRAEPLATAQIPPSPGGRTGDDFPWVRAECVPAAPELLSTRCIELEFNAVIR
jgi:hypothetical protein